MHNGTLHILYISQYFPPEMGAAPARVSQLSKRWLVQGHRVTVLTAFPNHPTGQVPSPYRQRMWRLMLREWVDGVRVIRTMLLPMPNRRAWERMVRDGSFAVSASLMSPFVGRPDVVIATSPQLLVGLVGWWCSRIHRVPFIFEVRDLWPESLIATEMGRSESIFIKALDRLAMFLYRRCTHIVTVTEAMRNYLVHQRDIPAEKVSVIEPGVELETFKPVPPSEELRRCLGLGKRFVASYIGTLGLAHGLDIVLDAAQILKDRLPDCIFLLIGEGARKEHMVHEAALRGLTNVHFVGQQPHNRIPMFLAISDVCLVLLRNASLFSTVIPSKIPEYMACQRPVVTNVDGETRRIVEESGAGIFVPPGNPASLADTVECLYHDSQRRKSMGIAGRAYAERRFSRAAHSQAYIEIIKRIAT